MDIHIYNSQREEVSSIMNRLYRCRLTTTSGGNISLRINDELFCITPSQYDKGALHKDLIAVVTLDGENLTPHLPLSIEMEMHRKALCARADICAVVHAHPTYASAFTAMKRPIHTQLLAESFFLLENPSFASYARMGSVELADAVTACLQSSNVVLMENHGVLTVGENLLKAFDLIEVLENCAHMTYITETLASCKSGWEISPLSVERQQELLIMKYGPQRNR